VERADFTIQVFTMEDEKSAERGTPTAIDNDELPDDFIGYRRSSQSLMAIATPRDDETVVAMGGGWIYEHDHKPQLLWIQAAEVDAPYRRKGLERILIGALLETGQSRGFAGVCIARHVRKHLKLKRWWQFWK